MKSVCSFQSISVPHIGNGGWVIYAIYVVSNTSRFRPIMILPNHEKTATIHWLIMLQLIKCRQAWRAKIIKVLWNMPASVLVLMEHHEMNKWSNTSSEWRSICFFYCKHSLRLVTWEDILVIANIFVLVQT